MQKISAIYDGVNLIPKQPIPAEGRYEVVVTFGEQLSKEPAALVEPKKRPFPEIFGEWSGKVWMSDDFDEPLEEMRDYM